MRRSSVASQFHQPFPDDWKSYIDDSLSSLYSKNLDTSSLRPDFKSRLESEFFLLSRSSSEWHKFVTSDRIRSIYSYLCENFVWPEYGIYPDKFDASLFAFGPFPEPDMFPGLNDLAQQIRFLSDDFLSIPRRMYSLTREFIYLGDWRSSSIFDSSSPNYPPLLSYIPSLLPTLLSCPLFSRLFHLCSEGNQIPYFRLQLSILSRDSSIVPHFGITNQRLRVHLPIIVPEGDLFIFSHNLKSTWRLGQPLILNDAYIHGVMNNTSGDRLVLILDLPHPDLFVSFGIV